VFLSETILSESHCVVVNSCASVREDPICRLIISCLLVVLLSFSTLRFRKVKTVLINEMIMVYCVPLYYQQG
jgi:hypothetical protein